MDSLEIGRKGEEICCIYLENNGHDVIERNYKVKSGEIDVISKKGGVIYFVEVKTTVRDVRYTQEMHQRPEENVNRSKMKKLSRAIQIYLDEKKEHSDLEWEFLVVAINLDLKTKKAYVMMISETLMDKS